MPSTRTPLSTARLTPRPMSPCGTWVPPFFLVFFSLGGSPPVWKRDTGFFFFSDLMGLVLESESSSSSLVLMAGGGHRGHHRSAPGAVGLGWCCEAAGLSAPTNSPHTFLLAFLLLPLPVHLEHGHWLLLGAFGRFGFAIGVVLLSWWDRGDDKWLHRWMGMGSDREVARWGQQEDVMGSGQLPCSPPSLPGQQWGWGAGGPFIPARTDTSDNGAGLKPSPSPRHLPFGFSFFSRLSPEGGSLGSFFLSFFGGSLFSISSSSSSESSAGSTQRGHHSISNASTLCTEGTRTPRLVSRECPSAALAGVGTHPPARRVLGPAACWTRPVPDAARTVTSPSRGCSPGVWNRGGGGEILYFLPTPSFCSRNTSSVLVAPASRHRSVPRDCVPMQAQLCSQHRACSSSAPFIPCV